MSSANPTRLEGDVYVAGNLASKSFTLPASAVTNANVAAGAALAQSKLEHQHRIGYGQPNTTATSETRVVFTCYGATGTILDFRAGSIVAALTTATVTVDLKKNGVSVLSAPITLDSGNAARVTEAASLSVTAMVAGDVLEEVITAAAAGGTLPTGVFTALTVKEDAQ